MSWLLAIALAVQAGPVSGAFPAETPPKFADGLDQIGMYTPNTQLLSWCSSKDDAEVRSCFGFIGGVVDASGMIDVGFPRGPIDTSGGDGARTMMDIRSAVLVYLRSLPNIRMTDPAARSVYDALVTRYPYKGRHSADIPYRPGAGAAKSAKPVD